MPELPVKEVRLSELHLPEIKRDEIVRSLSEVRVPTFDLAGMERPRLQLPEGIRRIDWRSIDLSGALAGAAAVARLGRPIARRSRWPFVAGTVIVIGAATAVILANPAVRERAARTFRDVRARLDERMHPSEFLDVDGDLSAQDATDTAGLPIEADVFAPAGAPAPDAGAEPVGTPAPMQDLTLAARAGRSPDEANGQA
jgi:hypothetical protein